MSYYPSSSQPNRRQNSPYCSPGSYHSSAGLSTSSPEESGKTVSVSCQDPMPVYRQHSTSNYASAQHGSPFYACDSGSSPVENVYGPQTYPSYPCSSSNHPFGYEGYRGQAGSVPTSVPLSYQNSSPSLAYATLDSGRHAKSSPSPPSGQTVHRSQLRSPPPRDLAHGLPLRALQTSPANRLLSRPEHATKAKTRSIDSGTNSRSISTSSHEGSSKSGKKPTQIKGYISTLDARLSRLETMLDEIVPTNSSAITEAHSKVRQTVAAQQLGSSHLSRGSRQRSNIQASGSEAQRYAIDVPDDDLLDGVMEDVLLAGRPVTQIDTTHSNRSPPSRRTEQSTQGTSSRSDNQLSSVKILLNRNQR